jgi:hypothetical protein
MMMQSNTKLTGEAIAAVKTGAPPVAVVGATVAGLSLQDWVYILTGIWLIAQTAWLIFRAVRDVRGRKVTDDG